ncbi:MAG: PatA/PatG family cyanobactin maturation protease [Oscillatoriaceae cyanobacterium Prado104]|jgi:cyanobactin maturation PatA/PatG family protease|nr:PatA/PatG family cyanobactin maturation protease [Oscillatoriaceae cyanobacterium Prado104]
MPELIAISGIPELWTNTLGDTRITIAILDGVVDMERTCFRGANLSQIKPYWQEEPEPISPADLETYREIETLKKKLADLKQDDSETAVKDQKIQDLESEIDRVQETIPEAIRYRLDFSFHATHIASSIFGQHGSPVPGVAPRCTGINIPLELSGIGSEFASPLNLARAFNLAMECGANIIHCAACHPTQTGLAHELISRAVKQCQDNGILVVAPGGNDKGECWCIPAVLPNVIAVGAMRDGGQPFKFSNYGGEYQKQGILAPGENILGAQPGTDKPVRKKGSSVAAPIVTGVAALLMSLQLKRGEKPNAEAVRSALLNSAIPCDAKEVEEPERCLRGKLNIPGAVRLLTGEPLTGFVPVRNSLAGFVSTPKTFSKMLPQSFDRELDREQKFAVPESAIANSLSAREERQTGLSRSTVAEPTATVREVHPSEIVTLPNTPVTAVASDREESGIAASQVSNLVYVLGTIGYDFGTEARRDTFKQMMPAVNIDGTVVPPNPYDAAQMVAYLEQNPTEAKALIWTLNLELNPIYVIEPKNAFADDMYDTMVQMLAGQIQPENSEDYIERVSIPGRLKEKAVELFSGQLVPAIEVQYSRGMYGWQVNDLARSALANTSNWMPTVTDEAIERSLATFLERIYFELGNVGKTARDRALNFAATNAFQAAATFAEAVSRGMQLKSIEVEKSPFCRTDSDCWEVKLLFFDPENDRRANKVFRFTIDVKDVMPVTLGEVRSWSVPR